MYRAHDADGRVQHTHLQRQGMKAQQHFYTMAKLPINSKLCGGFIIPIVLLTGKVHSCFVERIKQYEKVVHIQLTSARRREAEVSEHAFHHILHGRLILCHHLGGKEVRCEGGGVRYEGRE